MHSNHDNQAPIARRRIFLKNTDCADTSNIKPLEREMRVLVVNSSQEMAKEITMQLTLGLPGCALTYAPTLALAKWILSRRKIDLLVSSPMLPDGNITKLNAVLAKLADPPDVVVVGSSNPKLLGESGYSAIASRTMRAPSVRVRPAAPLRDSIKSLGDDLRNDLNNPLQEIVAMVYVAKAGDTSSPAIGQALDAIDRAAHNMASIVKGLEDKIRRAVAP